MPDERDRRRHRRVACDRRLSVQVLSSVQDPSAGDRAVAGDASDVSAGGLRLRVDGPLPVGHNLDLWIRVQGRAGTFMLSGKVKWAEGDAGGWWIGIQLLERPTDDVAYWLDMIRGELQYRER